MKALNYRALGFIVVLLIAGCGGGGGGAGSSPPPLPPPPPPPPVITTPPLTLSSSVPANAAANVSRDIALTLVFSAAVDPATVIPANFALSAPSGAQAVTVSAAGTQVTITPSTALQPVLAYSLTVSTAVHGLGGEQLASPVSLTFTTRGAAWSTPVLIEGDDIGSVRRLQTAIDDSGNAFAVWDEDEGAHNNVWVNRYVPGSGWGTATVLENEPGDAFAPQIAVSAIGNAIAVWQQSDGTRYNIMASEFTPASGWSVPAEIDNDPSDARNVQIAMNAHGDAFVVWTQTSPIRPITIWARRYVAGAGWAALSRIQTNTGGDGFFPQIAIDPNGKAVAVWHQTDGTRYNVWANRYTPGADWSSNAQLIENDDTDNAEFAQVGIDANGNAIAVWQQHDGTRFSIMSNRLPNGGDWGSAVQIDNEDEEAFGPQVAMSDAGDAIVVWVQQLGMSFNIAGNRYTTAGGWSTAQLIETGDGRTTEPRIAPAPGGGAYAVWIQNDGTRFDGIASRYVPGSGWETPAPIETESGDTFDPRVAVNRSGTVQAIWRQHDGLRFNVWASRYE